MVQLEARVPGAAPTVFHPPSFPCTIGRSPDAGVQIVAPGVWERHVTLVWDRGAGFRLTASEGATSLVNGQPIQDSAVRNGDLIELGSCKIRFWLTPVTQKSGRPGETLFWVALLTVAVLEVLLIRMLAG